MSNGKGSGADENATAVSGKTAEAEIVIPDKSQIAREFYNKMKGEAEFVKKHASGNYDTSIFDNPFFERFIIGELEKIYDISHAIGEFDEASSLPERVLKRYAP